MLEKIIFIVGSPRSGSSLIYNALCSNKFFNPAIPETHLVTNLIKNFYKQYKRNNSFEKNYFFEDIDDTKSYFKKCIEIFFNKIAKKYKVTHIVLKSIMLAENINILNAVYPEIYFLMTIRDPRDIITSMINVGKKQEKLNTLNHFPRNIELLCQKINLSYRFYLEKNQKDFLKEKVLSLKYEDFILNPSKSLNTIISKISSNIVYEKDFDIWERSSSNYKANDSESQNPYISELWNKPINNDKIGIYKDGLTKKEIKEVNSYCSEIINLFNY